jgi:hypothetical protein
MSRTCRISLVLAAALTFSCLASAPANGLEKRGPFRGQLVDVETGEPIAGAAILVIWWEAIFSPVGHPTERFYDTRETATDAQGRFEVPRLSVPFWKLGVNVGRMHYFAPGYAPDAEVVTPPDGQPFVAPTVVQMRRLKTGEERRKYVRGQLPAGVPHEKMLEFIRTLNQERSTLGLDTYR